MTLERLPLGFREVVGEQSLRAGWGWCIHIRPDPLYTPPGHSEAFFCTKSMVNSHPPVLVTGAVAPQLAEEREEMTSFTAGKGRGLSLRKVSKGNKVQSACLFSSAVPDFFTEGRGQLF